ncbi:MAG: IMS domain-containing protein [Cyanobium usitatum Tobar12.5m-G36]|nr:IMS domain-containing protein [Cyanobium usitatum Tobar12.5m-G36]
MSTARQLVESWLVYKKTIFSTPYDISAIENFVVNPGPLYSDITRPGGSVDWLRSNNSSYYYRELKVLDVSDFRQFPDRAHLTVRIVEDLELRTPRGIDRSKSGRKTQSWVYELKLNQYKWLVYDYRKDI